MALTPNPALLVQLNVNECVKATIAQDQSLLNLLPTLAQHVWLQSSPLSHSARLSSGQLSQ